MTATSQEPAVAAHLPEGSGAIVVHRMLERRLSGYRVYGYNPWLTLFPPLLRLGQPRGALDLVHTTPDYGLFFRRRGVPLVLTFHNFVLDAFMHAYSTPAQRLHYRTDLRWFVRAALRHAAAVTAVSHHTAGLVRRELGFAGPIAVIPNGVDTTRFSPRRGESHRPIKVLFSGNPSRRKGAQWLGAIAAALPPGVRMYAAAGLSGGHLAGVESLGRVPYAEMPRLYAGMDILLMPTVREGMSLAVLEAMACGLPVVASDCTSLPEQVVHGRGGLLCPLGDVAAFVRAITELAASPALRREMGAFNRERVETHFTAERMVAAYRALFRQLLGTD